MPVTNTSYIPYATVGRVITVLRKLREDRMPDKVDQTALTRVGIPEGSTLRVIAALKFLGLINEGGNKTELADRLARAKSDEYPMVLAEIVRAAYSDVFVHLDPATASEIDFHDAFRGFSPAKQRARMITLFVGLCQEAKIMEGEPTIVNANRPTERKTSPAGNGTGASSEKTAVRKPAETPTVPTPPASSSPNNLSTTDAMRFNIDSRYKRLIFLHEDLPKDGKWTAEKRENWVSLYTFYLDYLVKVVQGEEDNSQ